MSTKIYKKFPIVTETACQLKWNHSTVFLTNLKTASCHRVIQNSFDLEKFDFHNTPEKIRDRKLMLEGKWPGHGCEHCKATEDAGGISDRILHLDFPGFNPPPELDSDLTAVNVTPRILEIYFSNNCNLKCIYCVPHFSSQINEEGRKFGQFHNGNVYIQGYKRIPEEFAEATEGMFRWLDNNIQHLDKLMILGGEPFIQKETQRLIDFLKTKTLPNLNLVLFSNLTIDHDKFVQQIENLKQVKQTAGLEQIQIIGSLDCWGAEAEYVRKNLDLELFKKNFEYVLHNTDFILNINSVLTTLTVPSMPNLARQINAWSRVRTVYWSMMKAGGSDYIHPHIFGPAVMDLGFQETLDVFDDLGDIEKRNYKEYFQGLAAEFRASEPNYSAQRDLKIYLTELDRRRGTDYRITFPTIANLLEAIEI